MPAEMEGQTPVTAGAQTERLRVLLVDDNASVLRFLASAFSSNNCQVTTAATAEQALEQLGDDPFHLVVSDIKMPGLSGLDLLRAVKGKQPGTPVVLITGVPSVNSAVFGLRHGAYDYLPKPFSITEVKDLIGRLRRRDRADGNGSVNYPAGLTEELARRQAGVEADLAHRRGGAAGTRAQPLRGKGARATPCRASGATARSCCCATRAVNSTRAARARRRWSARSWRSCSASFGDVVKTGGRETFSADEARARLRGPRSARAGGGRRDGHPLRRAQCRERRLPAGREGAPARLRARPRRSRCRRSSCASTSSGT